MKILSIDLSTKNTGWAIFNQENKELIQSGCINSSSLDVIKRIYIMRDGIKTILQNNSDIKKVILEEVRPDNYGNGVGNQHTQKILMWCQAAIAFMIYDLDKTIEIEYIYPSSWRSVIGIRNGRGIKRSELKAADIQFVKNHFNIDVNDDEADAIGIGLAACLENAQNLQGDYNWE